MNFSQSLAYLNSFYDLEKTMMLSAERRWKLERMRHLLKVFGNPHNSFSSVVIVGTKGKGSTGFFLQSILKEAGISAGFYSSPHLESPRERIRINGEMISKRCWVKLITQIRSVIASPQLLVGAAISRLGIASSASPSRNDKAAYTYFEIMTLMAALAFKASGVKIAVFEAGMGGRLDAVNALGAPLVIVTPIHFDHQEFLGDTIAKIAAEKAAVIHAGNDVIMAPQLTEAERVVRARVRQQKARLWPVTHKIGLPLGLRGEHQAWNASAAVLASKILIETLNVRRVEEVLKQPSRSTSQVSVGLMRIPAKAIKAGLAAKDWPGRFEIAAGRPRVILDGAHNPAAVEVLVKTLRQMRGLNNIHKRVLIFGVTRDKDSREMLKTLAQFFSTVILVPLRSSRGKSAAELCAEARTFFPVQIPTEHLQEAFHLGKSLAGPAGTLVITGSFYLVGAAQEELRRRGGKL